MGVKISALSSASTPLSGTEEVPLVQNGTTRKVAASAFVSNLSGNFFLTGVSAVAIGAGTTNNWAPVLTNFSRLRITPAGAATLTGLVGGVDGKVIILTNVSAVDDITIMAQSGLSTAGNRFAMNGDSILPPGCAAMFLYDGSLSRWVRLGF
jgi:hypothetical protein